MKNGWQCKQLGNLCEVIAGQSPEGKYYNTEGKGTPFYQGKKDFGEKFISPPTTWTTQSTKIARDGDILMSVRAPVGPINFATNEVCIGRGLAALRCKAELNRNFLFYQLLHLQPVIAGKEGAVFASINKLEIEKLPIIFAPPLEQQRIVDILDKTFEVIATAKANAEKNIRNAHILFESYLNDVYIKCGIEWLKKMLVEVCQIKPPKAEARCRLSPTDMVSFVPMEDLGIDAKTFEAKQTRPLAEVSSSYTYFAENDILLAKITPCFENGKLGIATNLTNGIGFGSSEYIVFRPNPSLNKEWLYYLLSRDEFRNEGAENMSGAVGHKRVTKEFIERYQIPIPPLPEQEQIVAKLDSLREETSRLEYIYQSKLSALDALKKSLLHQAFTGNL